MNLLELLEQDGIKTKRMGRTYRARCPWHNGRTSTSLSIDMEKGLYFCHGCGKHGDAIQYLRDTRGLSYQEACLELGIGPHRERSDRQIERRGFVPRETTTPGDLWQRKAGTFLEWAQKTLWQNPEALDFLHGRGLRDETIRVARLGWNPRTRYEERTSWGLEPLQDESSDKALWLPRGLVIPLVLSGAILRLRIRRPTGGPRYYIMPGSDMRPMGLHLDRKALVIVESELDGFLIDQEAGDLAGVISLGSAQAKPDERTDHALNGANLILVALDFDDAGAKAAWQFWLSTYPNARRWPCPIGKDPSEAFQKGLSIRAWVEAGLTVKPSSLLREKPTEAAIEPFPKEWLERYDDTQLERLAMMTMDGGLSDIEAEQQFLGRNGQGLFPDIHQETNDRNLTRVFGKRLDWEHENRA